VQKVTPERNNCPKKRSRGKKKKKLVWEPLWFGGRNEEKINEK
jgi:hypothetical protein